MSRYVIKNKNGDIIFKSYWYEDIYDKYITLFNPQEIDKYIKNKNKILTGFKIYRKIYLFYIDLRFFGFFSKIINKIKNILDEIVWGD